MIDLFDASKNYYAVLGVGQECEVAAIKTAFRKLARQFHPDVNDHPNAKRRFQEVSEAYEVLSRHRQTYDAAVGALRQAAATSAQNRSHTRHAHGHARHTNHNHHHSHHQQTRQQTYGQAIAGHDRVMVYPVTLKYAFYLLRQGHFFIPSLKTKLTFDRHSMMGKQVRFKGKGFPGMFGGPAGDYIVSFKLTHHTPFHIEGGHLYMQLKISKSIWLEGGDVYFDAPTGLFKVKIRPQMHLNTQLRFKDKGLPADNALAGGHLFAKLVLEG